MEILKVESLSKIYGEGNNKVEALKNVSFSINRGEFTAIVGASGSGKSTLLHVLGGLDRPSSGKVYLDGEDIYRLNEEKLAIFRRRNIGFVFQFFNLIPVLDVEENIGLPALLDKEKVDKSYLEEVINMLGLKERIKHLPSELSGGQQQRVSIGRALINKPAIILADEPTGNLDSHSSTDVYKVFRDVNEKFKTTFLVITHDDRIAKKCDRIIQIEDGKVSG